MSNEILKMNEDLVKDEMYLSEDTGTGVLNTINAQTTHEVNKEILTNDEMAALIKELDNFNYIELVQYKKQLTYEIESIDYQYQMAKSVIDMKKNMDTLSNAMSTDDDITKKIAEENVKDTLDTDDIEKFIESKDGVVKNLSNVISIVDEKIAAMGEQEITTSFLTAQMLDILEKKLVAIEGKEGAEIEKYRKNYNLLIDFFKNRTDVSFLINKLESRRVQLKNDYRRFKPEDAANFTKRSCDILHNFITPAMIESVYDYLSNLYGRDKDAIFTIYYLSIIYADLRKYNKLVLYKWVELFFMNILNIIDNAYDLEGGPEAYNEKILELHAVLKNCVA